MSNTLRWKQRIKTFLAGGVLALALFGVAAAGPFEDGLAAYQRGDYVAAMGYWRPLADQGDDRAQTNLGRMYAFCRGRAAGLRTGRCVVP
jgi:uncharacterized protein